MTAPPGRVLALDVGGGTIKAAFVGRDGALAGRARRATGRDRGADAVVATVLDVAAELTAGAPAPPPAVGVAAPGIVADTAGVAELSATIGWRDVPLRRLLEERLGLPVVLGHDVRAGAVAEARAGAGRAAGDFVFVAIGTSIGAAVVIDGRPYPGAHWRGGELGHLVVRPGGGPCGCGQRGCLDTLASGAALADRYRTASGGALGGTAGALEVVRRARDGEPAALAVWHEAIEALADALLMCSALLDPAAVVLGGGLACCGETLLTPLRRALGHRATFHAPPAIVGAGLGDEAGCVGAGLLAWDLLDAREPR
ncbi:ROK family protein [Actinomadura miaoliensis]|uniref:ROK family protein n=1 Tax=Actinomadura miaoliensis TaxID=430685 RepID=A0ABP7X2G1_9ACTN